MCGISNIQLGEKKMHSASLWGILLQRNHSTRHRWVDKYKMGLKEIGWVYVHGLESSASG